MSKIWKRNFDLVKRPDTEIYSKFCDWGIIGMEGYDGILITCCGDPKLDPLGAAARALARAAKKRSGIRKDGFEKFPSALLDIKIITIYMSFFM